MQPAANHESYSQRVSIHYVWRRTAIPTCNPLAGVYCHSPNEKNKTVLNGCHCGTVSLCATTQPQRDGAARQSRHDVKPRLHQRNMLRSTCCLKQQVARNMLLVAVNKIVARTSNILRATSNLLQATSYLLPATCCAGVNAALCT